MKKLLFVASLFFAFSLAHAQSSKEAILDYLKTASENTLVSLPDALEKWRNTVNPSSLWGYDAPSSPIYLADVFSFLYEETGNVAYAETAIDLLASYGSLRDAYPQSYYDSRIEYAEGVPITANFFFIPSLSRAYLRLKDYQGWNQRTKERVADEIAFVLDFLFRFPEWGAHNRAMLRAEAWMYGYLAMPNHPNALKWKKMADFVAKDSLNGWEIEDASSYNPIWLISVLNFALASNNTSYDHAHFFQYYKDYFKGLFTPADNIPDFGDSNWNSSLGRYYAVFEKFASTFHDEEAKWMANRMFQKITKQTPSLGNAVFLMEGYQWIDETVASSQPKSSSQEVADDVIGKKIVFRNGWLPNSTYLLLNYRDEGASGFNGRENLRNSLSVEEEKMHHGHSDENDLSLLMSNGSVLLHDGGYRSGLPSGAYGGFRADYFHNRMVVRKNKRDRYQTVKEFIQNSGAYRPVTTKKIDFLTFENVEMSRTRLSDATLGYDWDRIITYVKEDDYFIVVDAIKFKETDYYTLTNLFHTQSILAESDHTYLTSIDSIQTTKLPQNRNLLIQFLNNEAKTDSSYSEERHFQAEKAIYQTQSSHYLAGTLEVFVTLLYPLDKQQSSSSIGQTFTLLPSTNSPDNLGIKISSPNKTEYLGIKLDLESALSRENIRPRFTWDLGKATYGDFETDAHFFYAKTTENDLYYASSEFMKVNFKGKPLVSAFPNMFGLQLDGAPDREGFVKWRAWEETLQQRK